MEPTASPPPEPRRNGYPATLDVQRPAELDRWRPLVQWFLAIPHFIVLYVFGIVSGAVAFLSWIVVVITGRLPEGFATLQALYLRYTNRTIAYAGFLRDEYPPFAFDTVSAEPGDYPPVLVDVRPELDDRNRLTAFFRWLLVIPHGIVLGLLGIVLWFAWLAALVAVVVTGRWPDGLWTFAVGYLRWTLRVDAYALLLTDRYPPFSLD